MELMFEKSRFPYLKCILHSNNHTEQTDEIIVPDNYPDIQSIICAHADAIIRGKDCRNGSVTINGEIIGTILYSPEDQSFPRNLEFRFPFVSKSEDSSLTESTSIVCTPKVTAADGRVLNSRKALLRADIDCCILAFENREEEIFNLKELPESLQVMEETYTLNLPLEVSEKTFTISDHLEISETRPPVIKIYRISNHIEVVDQKVVANKAVFKGNILTKILYLSEDDSLYTHTQKFPFSQYCELRKDYDDESVELLPTITGYDVEFISENDPFKGLLTVNLLMQCVIVGNKILRIEKDAYSTTENLEPIWHQYQFQCCVDRHSEVRNVRHQIKADLSEILDVDVYTSVSRSQCKHDHISITTPTSIHLLGRSKQGEIVSITDKLELLQDFPASDVLKCLSAARIEGNIQTALLSDGPEILFDVALEHTFTCEQSFQTLCGGNTESLESSEARPSVIIRNATKSTSLWDLAKQYKSRKDVICEVNEIHEDILSHDQMLLIPIG